MSTLLHLDASPRGARSHSRQLGDAFARAWADSHPGGRVIHRDLALNPVPHVDEAWIAGAFAPPASWSPESRAAMRISDALVDELLSADRIVLASPMFNLSIPSALKAWIDQVVRAGRTFAVDAKGAYSGLVQGRRLVVATARGGVLAGTPYDFQEPYLRAIFGFIGVTDVQFVHAEGLAGGDEARATALDAARARLLALAPSF